MWLLVLMIPYSSFAQQEIEQLVETLDNKIPGILHDFSVPGAAVAIIDNGEIVIQKGYGYADVEKQVEVTAQTGFNIASISKTVAAWGVMKLVKSGKIDLDAPAENYLTRWQFPESDYDSKEVTIRRLLSHTAGLSLHGYPGWTPEDVLPTVEESLNGKTNGSGAVEIIMQPGTRYQYSGGGYTVLQLIVEEVTGRSFADYMQTEILNPLGMINSSFDINEMIMAATATEYDNFGEITDFELFTAQAAAGLHTTIEDFSRFALANMFHNKTGKTNNTVLPAETIELMMEPAPASNGYGLGYEIMTRDILQGLKGHTGGNTGWQTMFLIDPSLESGFIVFTNSGAGYNVINAIYCEWLAWKKGQVLWEDCAMQPSIANKLKQIIEMEGIEGIQSKYLSLKESYPNDYNFRENQLNNLGYFYLSRNEIEYALAIFKINVDAFPHAFNVYDSYGEALLAQGDREQAIENYINSVELNPGNQHGVQVLNSLGISDNDLLEQLSVAIDGKILSDYYGRYQTSTGDIVSLSSNDEGRFIAEFDEQPHKLVTQSTHRFVALGDGSVFSFFTAATGQPGLWTRQRIWRKLPDEMNHSNSRSTGNFLVLRNSPSWNRLTDFEDVIIELGCSLVSKESSALASLDLSAYDVIIIPGAQSEEFYQDYVNYAEHVDTYVANGGILMLELNGATRSSLILPRDISMVNNPALENAIIDSTHPIFLPLEGKSRMHARYASSGYFEGVPEDVHILAYLISILFAKIID